MMKIMMVVNEDYDAYDNDNNDYDHHDDGDVMIMIEDD